MDLQDLRPRKGNDTYRIGDSDDLVLMENIGSVPSGGVCLQEHAVLLICTEGKAQFEYDGVVVKIQKNDLFLYLNHSIVSNFLTSSDFNCRQIWLTSNEMGNIEMYTPISVPDLSMLKLHPVVHLTDDEINLLGIYFQLLCDRMKCSTPVVASEIIRSLFGTMLLELLSICGIMWCECQSRMCRRKPIPVSIKSASSTNSCGWWKRATAASAGWMKLPASCASRRNISLPFSRK